MSNIPQPIIDEVLSRQVAAASLSGQSPAQIAKALSLSTKLVKEIVNSPRFKEIVETSAEDELGPVLARAKIRTAKMVEKALNRIDCILTEGEDGDALKAATLVLKIVGVDETEAKSSDQVLNIIMPGADQPVTIEVPSDEV